MLGGKKITQNKVTISSATTKKCSTTTLTCQKNCGLKNQMNYESAEKQFSHTYPAAFLINHCHPKRTNLCCCAVSMIDEHVLGRCKVQQCFAISLKVSQREKKSLFNLCNSYPLLVLMNRNSRKQNRHKIFLYLYCVWCVFFVWCHKSKHQTILLKPCVEAVICNCTLWIDSRSLHYAESLWKPKYLFYKIITCQK